MQHGETSRRLRFGDGFRVDPQTSLFAELKALLGESRVPAAVGRHGRYTGHRNGAGNGIGNGAHGYSGRNGFGTGK